MKIVDINCMLGAYFEPINGSFETAGTLIDEMDRCGINEAFAYSGISREYDIWQGNEEIFAETNTNTRIHPIWLLGLSFNRKLPEPDAYISEGLRRGVRLFRLFFGSFISETTGIDLVAYESVFLALSKHRCPVIIEFEAAFKLSSSELEQLDAMLDKYPEIPVILSSQCYDRLIIQIIPRLNKYMNLHVSTTGFHAQGDAEKLISAGFVDRIIFGSGFPWFSCAVSKITLEYEGIDDMDKEKIYTKNIERLIKGILL